MVPVIAGDGTATIEDQADGAVCLRINGGDCGTTDGGTGGDSGGDSTTGTVVPSGVALLRARAAGMPADACARVNAGDCGTSDGGTGGDTGDDNTVVPVIAGDGTATIEDQADGTVCLRINGGDCGTSDGDTGGDTGGGGTDITDTLVPSGVDLVRATAAGILDRADSGTGDASQTLSTVPRVFWPSPMTWPRAWLAC